MSILVLSCLNYKIMKSREPSLIIFCLSYHGFTFFSFNNVILKNVYFEAFTHGRINAFLQELQEEHKLVKFFVYISHG
jgi:hypothetical protein